MKEAPNFPKTINEAFENIHSNPEFKEKAELSELSPEFTALDTFAIPEDLVQNQKKFLTWFELRFFKLNKAEDFQLFSDTLQEALNILETNKFILSPRIGENFSLSAVIKKRVSTGFTNPEEIMSLFKKVAVKNTPENYKDFLSPNRKSAAGAERLSVCRILSIAYVLDKLAREHNFEKFLDYAHSVLGRSERNEDESGLLSTLITPKKPDILIGPQNPDDIFAWLEKGEILKGCHLNNVGFPKKRSFYIPEVHTGTKSGLRAFLKLLRDPGAEFQPLSDFLRLRFIFDNNKSTEEILDVMRAIQEEAKTKKDVRTEIEFRAKNYLSEKDLKEYFPETPDKEDTNIRSGFLKKIKIDRNPSTAGKYKNMSAKIKLYRPGTKTPFFSFEIQFMRKKELEKNESLEMPSNHFLLVIRQAVWAFSRFTGKATQEEMTNSLKEYLTEYVETRKIPTVLTGQPHHPEEYGSGEIVADFSGTIDEQAKKLFKFLVDEGTIKKISPSFPEIEKPTKNSRFTSQFYTSKKAREAVLKLLGVWIKKEKKTKEPEDFEED